MKRFGQTAHIVVALDGLGLLGLGPGRFDDVRIDRALSKPLGVGELFGLFLEDIYEFATDDLALLFRIGDAGEFSHEAIDGVDHNELQTHVLFEGFANLFAFTLAQQTVVDEHAGKLVANGAVNECGGNRAVHAARKAENDFFAVGLLADHFDGFGDIVAHHPVGLAVADIRDKALEHEAALHGVRDFRMELHGVETAGFIGHAGDRAGRSRAHQLEAFGHDGDFVAVAHPNLEHAFAFGTFEVFDALKKLGVVVGAYFGVAEFALGAAFYATAKLLGHRLHAVADAEHGNSGTEHGRTHLIVGLFVGAHVRA